MLLSTCFSFQRLAPFLAFPNELPEGESVIGRLIFLVGPQVIPAGLSVHGQDPGSIPSDGPRQPCWVQFQLEGGRVSSLTLPVRQAVGPVFLTGQPGPVTSPL